MSVPYAFVDVTAFSDGGYKVVIVAGVLIIMLFLMVFGRLISRRLNQAGIGADDYVLLIATVLSMGLCAIAISFPIMDQRVEPVGQWFMAWMIIYGLSIAFSKCAILLLYIRVFTTIKRTFTITSWLVGFFVIMTGLANIFGAVFQCSPVAYAWDKSIPRGNCMDIVAFSRYMAIPNVVTGAVMLIMPLPVVWNLNIDVSAKIALTATFLHGIIGFIASCARLTILFTTTPPTFTPHTSLTWTIWTINEPANYIIAACLPTLRPIFMRILPSSFFILSHHHRNRDLSDETTAVGGKVSSLWPRGRRGGPKVEFGDRGFLSSSRLAGPWYGTQHQDEGAGKGGGADGDGEGRGGLEHGNEGGTGPRRSYTLKRSEGYDFDKRQVLVEKVERVEEEVVVVEEEKGEGKGEKGGL